MNICIKQHSLFGKTLFADNGIYEIGIPLEFGVRIGHFALLGEENIFFEQPNDMEIFSTADGWHLRGGHRIWIAPECKEDYIPDNDPVSFTVTDNSVTVMQNDDYIFNIKKSITITFSDDGSVIIDNNVKNISDNARRFSVWGITSVKPSGVQLIKLPFREDGMDPLNRISMWDYTSLGDKRVTYERELITIKHTCEQERYKIGVGHPVCPVTYENNGIVFEKYFDVFRDREYPDGNVSYETFLSQYMVEIESLSPYIDLAPGETASHREIWKLYKTK